MAAWTSLSSRSSTCSSASCARSSQRRPAASTISRRCGAAAMCCATRKTNPKSPLKFSQISAPQTATSRGLKLVAQLVDDEAPHIPLVSAGEVGLGIQVIAEQPPVQDAVAGGGREHDVLHAVVVDVAATEIMPRLVRHHHFREIAGIDLTHGQVGLFPIPLRCFVAYRPASHSDNGAAIDVQAI